jgi:hypothetical protein
MNSNSSKGYYETRKCGTGLPRWDGGARSLMQASKLRGGTNSRSRSPGRLGGVEPVRTTHAGVTVRDLLDAVKRRYLSEREVERLMAGFCSWPV